MAKTIGVLLLFSGILSLLLGAYINSNFGSSASLTGGVVSNIISQIDIKLGLFDYLAGAAFSISILCFIMAIVFLVRI